VYLFAVPLAWIKKGIVLPSRDTVEQQLAEQLALRLTDATDAAAALLCSHAVELAESAEMSSM